MTMPVEAPTTRIDLMSAELAQNPWPTLRALREHGPVHWHETQQRWLITSDQAVRKVLLDCDRFTVAGTVVEDLFGKDAFITMDERERHNRLRGIWAEAFRPKALNSLRHSVATIVDDLTAPLSERLLAGESVNVSDDLCRPLPTLVIALMMGVPASQLDNVVRWSDAMAGGGPAYLDESVRAAAIRTRDEAKESLAALLLELIQFRRHQPSDDLIGLMASSPAAKALPDGQLVQNLRQLLFAGNETTARWLGHILVTYAQYPEVQRELAVDRSLIRAANEEVMRWQGVIGTLPRRVCGGNTVVAGVALADGDHITCMTGAANRDPARFHNPDHFDIHRPPQPHVGFGIGLHNCLGAALARMEVDLAINALLNQVPSWTLAGEFHYTSLPVRGPLPVTIVLGER